MTKKDSPAEIKSIPKFSFAFKLKVVQEIENGLISKNFASKKYLASRSSIDYWCKKLGTDMNENNNHSTQKEIKKLKAKIEELEFINMVHKEALTEIFKKFGDDPKKSYAKQLEEFAREIEKRK
jgi:transposase-like protein